MAGLGSSLQREFSIKNRPLLSSGPDDGPSRAAAFGDEPGHHRQPWYPIRLPGIGACGMVEAMHSADTTRVGPQHPFRPIPTALATRQLTENRRPPPVASPRVASHGAGGGQDPEEPDRAGSLL